MDYSTFYVSTERYKEQGNLIKMFNDKDFKLSFKCTLNFCMEFLPFSTPFYRGQQEKPVMVIDQT